MNRLGGATQTIGVLIVLVALGVPTGSLAADESSVAREGVFDLRNYPGTLQTPFALRGEWEWYWGEIFTPQELENRRPSSFIEIPAELVSPGRGVATLRATIYLPRGGTGRSPALKIPYFGSAYRVYVNGRLLTQVGRIGTPPDYRDFHPQYLPVEAPIELSHDTGTREIEIVINVANFNHRRMRLLDISLGPQETIRRETQLGIIGGGIVFGSLLLLALYHLVLFFIHRSDRAFLYFALIAVVTALREGIVGERILVRIWPTIPPELMMKIGFSPIFLLPWLLVLYILALVPRAILPRLRNASVALLVLFGGILVMTPLPVYDWVFQYGLPLIIVYGVIALAVIIRMKPFEQPTAPRILVLGTAAIVGAAISDYLREIYSFDAPELFSAGILVFLLLQAYFLAWRLNAAHIATVKLRSETQAFAEELERRIADRTKDLEIANATLQTLSHIDPLTGIANRRAFEEALDREWRRCARAGTVVAIVMMDVDMFKRYNDYYGHPAGDHCLATVAESLKSVIHRSTDMIARYGGEEFIVLLPETGPEAAYSIAESMRATIEGLGIPHEASSVAEVVTASFGVVSIHADAQRDVTSLVEIADRALYGAKEAGRNRVFRADTHFL